MKVYVGGKYGDEPTVIAKSLEQAMVLTLDPYSTGEDEHNEQWSCAFVDGYKYHLRCTTTATDSDGTIAKLYVERCDVEEEEVGL